MNLAAMRQRAAFWIESTGPVRFVIAVITLNAITLGLATSERVMTHAGDLLMGMERIILAVFVVEIAIKLFAHGPRFFRSGWNVFDFIIVAISLLPTSGPLAILRVLRILRILRMLSMLPKLRVVIEALLQSLPGIGWVALLMAMIFYVFAVMGTQLFGEAFPQWFGHLGASFYTLFQIMTLESWSQGIARPVLESFPHAWIYFVVFILLSSFTMLNLFIGIIVSTMQAIHEEEVAETRAQTENRAQDERTRTLEEVQALRREVAALTARLGETPGASGSSGNPGA